MKSVQNFRTVQIWTSNNASRYFSSESELSGWLLGFVVGDYLFGRDYSLVKKWKYHSQYTLFDSKIDSMTVSKFFAYFVVFGHSNDTVSRYKQYTD